MARGIVGKLVSLLHEDAIAGPLCPSFLPGMYNCHTISYSFQKDHNDLIFLYITK